MIFYDLLLTFTSGQIPCLLALIYSRTNTTLGFSESSTFPLTEAITISIAMTRTITKTTNVHRHISCGYDENSHPYNTGNTTRYGFNSKLKTLGNAIRFISTANGLTSSSITFKVGHG